MKNKKRFNCDRCENGQIIRYGHVDNGTCWKCYGTGKLSYNPQVKGNCVTDDTSYEEFILNQRYAEEERKAQHEAWMAANNMFGNEDENYYHG